MNEARPHINDKKYDNKIAIPYKALRVASYDKLSIGMARVLKMTTPDFKDMFNKEMFIYALEHIESKYNDTIVPKDIEVFIRVIKSYKTNNVNRTPGQIKRVKNAIGYYNELVNLSYIVERLVMRNKKGLSK